MAKSKIIYVPIEEATKPKTGYTYIDRYWVFHNTKGLPFLDLEGKGHLHQSAPQCSTDSGITRHMRDSFYPDHEIKKLSIVFTGYDRVV